MEWKEKMITIKGSELANALQKAFQGGAGFAMRALGQVQLPDSFGEESVSAMLASVEKSREAKEEIQEALRQTEKAAAKRKEKAAAKRPLRRGKKGKR